MTTLEEIAQASECSLTRTLLAYWRKLIGTVGGVNRSRRFGFASSRL
jgi:hypothetical protein